MEAIQLELFDVNYHEAKDLVVSSHKRIMKPQLITKMKIYKNWILIDNLDRDIEKSAKLKHHYPLAVDLSKEKIYSSRDIESRILPIDKNAKKIDIVHYFKVSNVLRQKKIIYNKKKFQLENIK